jgi:hypothetical protein
MPHDFTSWFRLYRGNVIWLQREEFGAVLAILFRPRPGLACACSFQFVLPKRDGLYSIRDVAGC